MRSDGFVFFRSVWDSYQELERKDKELANKYLLAVIKYGLEGEYDESDPIINALMSNTTISIDRAHNRYSESQNNGAKGGRPSKFSPEQIISLYQQGNTTKQIANTLGCSIKTVQRALKEASEDIKESKEEFIF